MEDRFIYNLAEKLPNYHIRCSKSYLLIRKYYAVQSTHPLNLLIGNSTQKNSSHCNSLMEEYTHLWLLANANARCCLHSSYSAEFISEMCKICTVPVFVTPKGSFHWKHSPIPRNALIPPLSRSLTHILPEKFPLL